MCSMVGDNLNLIGQTVNSVSVSRDLYVSVCLCHMTCVCLYVCISVSHDLYMSMCLCVCVTLPVCICVSV